MSEATRRVACRKCGLMLSAVSLEALGAAIVDHENGAHGSGVTLTVTGDIVVKN